MKSNSIPKNQQKGRTPTLRVQTDIRAGWVPGQNVRNMLSEWRQSMPDSFWDPNKV
jgi:hypothetical protein